jgi:hypothetical protein
MKRKTIGLMSIATALASLGTVAQAGTPPVTLSEGASAATNEQAGAIKIIPNTTVLDSLSKGQS